MFCYFSNGIVGYCFVSFAIVRGVVKYCDVIPSIAREGFCVVKSYNALCKCS